MRHCIKCFQGFKNETKEILPPNKLIGSSRKHIMHDDGVDSGDGMMVI